MCGGLCGCVFACVIAGMFFRVCVVCVWLWLLGWAVRCVHVWLFAYVFVLGCVSVCV